MYGRASFEPSTRIGSRKNQRHRSPVTRMFEPKNSYDTWLIQELLSSSPSPWEPVYFRLQILPIWRQNLLFQAGPVRFKGERSCTQQSTLTHLRGAIHTIPPTILRQPISHFRNPGWTYSIGSNINQISKL